MEWFDGAVVAGLKPYIPLMVFLVISAGLGCAMVTLSFLCGMKRSDSEKLSAYECGFEAFGDARMKFDVRFYLVAILLIIFDLEIAFLFPWAVSFTSLGAAGFLSISLFLLILTLGFMYEWKQGALEWE